MIVVRLNIVIHTLRTFEFVSNWKSIIFGKIAHVNFLMKLTAFIRCYFIKEMADGF